MDSKIESAYKKKLYSLKEWRKKQGIKSDEAKATYRAKSERLYNAKLKKIEQRKETQYKNIVRKEKWKKPIEIKKKRDTLPVIRKKALAIRQKIARRERRDKNDMIKCISCWIIQRRDECDWGHYRAKRFHTRFDFSLDNIRPQCKKCNSTESRWLQGNLIPYRKNLITKIWERKVLELEEAERYSRTKDDYECLIKEWKKRL